MSSSRNSASDDSPGPPLENCPPSSSSSQTRARWNRPLPFQNSVSTLLQPPPSLEEASETSLSQEYNLQYSGPAIEDHDMHSLVAERRKTEHDPLLALIQMSALVKDEIDDHRRSEEERCYMEYLMSCLFQVNQAGTLERSAVLKFRDSVRSATEESGQIAIHPPIPHVFAHKKTMVHYFEVIKTLDATSRPKVLRLYNEQKEPVSPDVLYKIGDDLRQDLLILSSISLFNLRIRQTWHGGDKDDSLEKEQSLFDTMPPPQTPTYRVLPWGPQDGLIELMPNVSDQREWINNTSAQSYLASSAAAVVVGWVLGIGDRHQRNILSTEDGQVFHIDFGYAFGLHPPLLESAAVPVPHHMYADLKQEDLWEIFCDLCLILFDHVASGKDVLARGVEAMANMISYKVPKQVQDGSLDAFIRNQLSPEARDKFLQSIKSAPFNIRNEFKETVIPVWYRQVKRYHKHKEHGGNVVGHLKTEIEIFESAATDLDSAGRNLLPNLTHYSQQVERKLLRK